MLIWHDIYKKRESRVSCDVRGVSPPWHSSGSVTWLGYLVFALGNGTIKPYIETGLGVVKLGTIFNNNI